MGKEKINNYNKCENCEYLIDVFGNFVQYAKTKRFVDYEYWNNKMPYDCPFKEIKGD